MKPAEWDAIRGELARIAISLRECEAKSKARAAEVCPGDGDLAFIFIGRNAFDRNALVRGALSYECELAARQITALCEPRAPRRKVRR